VQEARRVERVSRPYIESGAREFFESAPFLDPFTLIPALGAVTERLRFTTFVLKLPIRSRSGCEERHVHRGAHGRSASLAQACEQRDAHQQHVEQRVSCSPTRVSVVRIFCFQRRILSGIGPVR
jgi:hypothetical protein